MMKINYGKTFGKAIRYAASRKILPLFLLDAIVVAGIIFAVAQFVEGEFVKGMIIFFPTLIVGILASLLLTATYIHNASEYWNGKQARLSSSYAYAKKKYAKLLGASVLVATATMAITIPLSFIPLLGGIASFLVAMALVLYPAVIVMENRSIVGSLKESYSLFMKHKMDVFIYWFLATVIELSIIILSFIPLLLASIPIISALIARNATAATVMDNALPLAVTGMFAILGMAFMTVMLTTSKVFLYNQLKKRR